MRQLLLILVFTIGCAHRVPKEWMVRPDTREMDYIVFTDTAAYKMLKIFKDSLPKEAGLCSSGQEFLDDSSRTYIKINDVVISQQDSSSPHGVWYHPKLYKEFGKQYTKGLGCEGKGSLVGYLHSHVVMEPGWWCTASEQDALFLAYDLSYLFLMTLCLDGRMEVLWQDGRRHPLRWELLPPK